MSENRTGISLNLLLFLLNILYFETELKGLLSVVGVNNKFECHCISGHCTTGMEIA